jgi:hypothetical protein
LEAIIKNIDFMEKSPRFEKEYTLHGGITDERKQEMNEKLNEGIGYII